MSLHAALFPAPRSIRTVEGDGPGGDAPVLVDHDPSLPAQGFQLRTGADGIRIVHADAAGLRYGQQALDQLRAHQDFARTAVVVEDWPDFAVRGFMLDISRDRVPTRRTLLRYLDLLVLARINHLELYTEHTFAYEGHEDVWQDASPLTADDVRWIDDQCAARGIELVPNQNTLGHWERWLARPRYSDRALNAEGFDMMGAHRPAATLRPTTENADFVGDLVEELTHAFRSRTVNIGADEPFELIVDQGDGVMPRDNATVYFDYVTRVAERLAARGYRVEFWADVFGEHPELMDRVPEGAIPVVWQYDSASLTRGVVENATKAQRERWASVGLDVDALQDGFRARARVLTDAGVPFWVAPGTSTWQSFTGRLDNAIENLADAADVGIANGAVGYLNTAWGDHGNYDPPAVSFGPIVYGGAVSWNVAANRDLDLVAVLNDRVVHDPTGATGRALVRIGGAAAALDAPVLNASQLFTVLHGAGDLPDGAWPDARGIDAATALLRSGLDDLERADPAALDGDDVIAETRQAIRFALFAADILRLGRGGIDALGSSEAGGLLVRLDGLLEGHRSIWLRRSRPGGLDDSTSRLAPLRRRLVIAASRVASPETLR